MPEAKVRSFLPSGSKREDRGPAIFGSVVVDIRPRTDRDIQGLAVGRKLQITSPVAAAADLLSTGRNVGDDHLQPRPRALMSPLR